MLFVQEIYIQQKKYLNNSLMLLNVKNIKKFLNKLENLLMKKSKLNNNH